MMTPDKSGTSPRDEHTKTDIEAIKRELEDIRKERMELDQKENLILTRLCLRPTRRVAVVAPIAGS
jgi:DNA-binding IclR family transcriptional regulator